ncbi:MAG TPA: hypothetical protein VF627_09885 [Abditibacterium sp.]
MSIKLSGLGRISLAVTGFAVAGGAFLGTTQTASATPATLGFYPSTDIYAGGTAHFDADSYTRTNVTNGNGATSGFTFGLGSETDNVLGRAEAGFDYNFLNTPTSVSFGRRISLNAKTQIYNNNDTGTRVVVGGWGLGSSRTNPNYLYLLGAKTFNGNRIHVGVARAMSDNIVTTGRTSLQLGYDRLITRKLSFVVDYYSGKGQLSGVQPTLYYLFNDKSDVGLGYFRANNRNSGALNNQLYICFDYNFDTRSKAAPVPETVPGAPAIN